MTNCSDGCGMYICVYTGTLHANIPIVMICMHECMLILFATSHSDFLFLVLAKHSVTCN